MSVLQRPAPYTPEQALRAGLGVFVAERELGRFSPEAQVAAWNRLDPLAQKAYVARGGGILQEAFGR